MYFVSDIDGTLLAQPGDRVIDGLPEALDRLQKCGVKIVLASGRTLHDVTLAAKRLRLDNYYAISSNGRVVTQMRKSQTVDTVYANYDIRLGIALANAGRKVVFQDINGNLTYLNTSLAPKNIWSPVKPVSELKLLNSLQTSFMVEFDGVWSDTQKPNFYHCDGYQTNWHLWVYDGRIYLQDMVIDKGVGLLELVNARGAEGIASIGDDINDLPIFMLSGEVYLMGNSSNELRTKINQRHTVVSDVESGGAIEAIDNLINKYLSLRAQLI